MATETAESKPPTCFWNELESRQMNDFKIKAIAPWFGAKRRLAPEIVRELGKHRVYWEPFCGSMAVLLAKPPCGGNETVNDLHGDLINLARVIQHDRLGPQLYRRLRRTLINETFYHEATARHRDRGYLGDVAPDVEAAYDYFIHVWLGRNGVAGQRHSKAGGTFCVRFTGNGGPPAVRWSSVVRSIPAWKRRMREVFILCRDAFELLERIDDAPGTAIYVDPPYIKEGESYVHKLKRKDHALLAHFLRRFTKARVVISYYDDPILEKLYPDWTKREMDVTKSLVNQSKRGKVGAVKAPEVLLMNGPSFANEESGLLF